MAVHAFTAAVLRAGCPVGARQRADAGAAVDRRVAERAGVGAVVAERARLAERDAGAAVPAAIAEVDRRAPGIGGADRTGGAEQARRDAGVRGRAAPRA